MLDNRYREQKYKIQMMIKREKCELGLQRNQSRKG